jgi:hypothetical protein
MDCKPCCFYGEASQVCHRIPGKGPPALARCSHYLENKGLGLIHLLNWRDAPSCGGEPYSASGTTDATRITCPDCAMMFKAFGSCTKEEMDADEN